MNRWIMFFLFFVTMTWTAACDDTDAVSQGNDPDAGTSGTDGDTDSDADSDSDADADTDTAPDPFEIADCDGAGRDPSLCEYEWCKKRSTYWNEWEQCTPLMTARCTATFVCYNAFLECLAEACPLGTAVPTDTDAKMPIYICDNDFTDCTMNAEML